MSMHIGRCWLDNQKQQLISDEGQIWQLDHTELAVISCLLNNRDKVVSRQTLYVYFNGDNKQLQLNPIIHKLHRFIGQKDATLLEVVGVQGYLLHGRKPPRSQLNASPYQAIPLLAYSMVVVVIALLIFWLLPKIDDIEVSFDNVYEQQITTDYGQTLTLQVFPHDKDQVNKVVNNSDHLQEQLLTCKHIPWQMIGYAISSDTSMIHFVLMKNNNKIPEYRNIKLFQHELNIYAINSAWLTEVGICG
ncbi:MAG: hypothetical protein ACRCT7_15000 [Shewanella sp.]